ncbi:MAG: hypothetical protein AUH85_08870 [Chloroflexi bacterium 13_1_40CM_4_68_4]|nr:MAG: hypothetical protein AUH85_08870 [Chloroflexi bacterium 13_1_40CM_4_68_4]
MPLVFAAIAPHGGIAVAEATPPEKRELAARTRAAMEELGRRFAAARPDATILLTPHHVHVEGALAVIVSNRLRGELGEDGHRIELTVPVDRALALAVLRAIGDAGVRVVGVSFGGNDPSSAVAPMDWGTLIPLWFMGGRADAPVPAVVVAPARDLTAKRIALIASCDHGHAHNRDGPYGFSPASREFDDRVVALVKADRLGELLAFGRSFVEEAKADSFWQMLMLHGAMGGRWRGELLSYEAPTYFGMLCAAYSPR